MGFYFAASIEPENVWFNKVVTGLFITQYYILPVIKDSTMLNDELES
jgi:hypothetical protein